MLVVREEHSSNPSYSLRAVPPWTPSFTALNSSFVLWCPFQDDLNYYGSDEALTQHPISKSQFDDRQYVFFFVVFLEGEMM